jgi:hypothetical protein
MFLNQQLTCTKKFIEEIEMKLITNTLVTKVVLILVLALFITTATSGQVARTQKPVIKQKAIANLIVGINSENEGLRKSAIYLSGKYEIDQTVDALIEQLKAEKIPSVRISIALALYKIGSEKGFEAIYTSALLESDPHVKRICSTIVEEYNANKYIFASRTN